MILCCLRQAIPKDQGTSNIVYSVLYLTSSVALARVALLSAGGVDKIAGLPLNNRN